MTRESQLSIGHKYFQTLSTLFPTVPLVRPRPPRQPRPLVPRRVPGRYVRQ